MSVAAVGVGLAAAGAGIAGSIMSADAQKDAAKKNRDAQQYAADKNYQQFIESRGSTGSAVLPLYLKSLEGRMADDANSAYKAYTRDPATVIADNQAKVDALSPAITGARNTTNDLFSGGVENKMLSNFKPVGAARLRFKRGAAIDALSKTINDINAAQSGRGFSGDSFGSNLLKFNARKSAGDAVADVNVQNAQDEQAIKQAVLQMQLSNLGLPMTMAKQDLALSSLPYDNYIDQLLQGQQPFKFFYIGQGNPPQVQPLTYTATPSAGQLALQGVSQAGGSYLNYMLQQQQQQQYLNAMQSLQNSMPANFTGSAPRGVTYEDGFYYPPMNPGSYVIPSGVS